ncbi:hypothetical protein GCM10009836_35650 [Pseudonocardia ailaonensis]|uniref:Uncharacterized protein n=1 Tax=Pseudonocardia ailaonensis TaxID=367279 RepID=A0ABN2N4N5_9PSEU
MDRAITADRLGRNGVGEHSVRADLMDVVCELARKRIRDVAPILAALTATGAAAVMVGRRRWWSLVLVRSCS